MDILPNHILFILASLGVVYSNPPEDPVDGHGVEEVRGYLKREHSLIKPYQGSGIGIPHWDFMGGTMVTGQQIRLTPDMKSRTGAVWNVIPCMSRDWELHVTFAVHGSTGELFGDGMGIWYIKERGIAGDVFGSINQFVGLGIFLDTYSNHNGPHNHAHPYVSAMVGNGSALYDHDRDGTHTQLAGCEAKFRNKDYETSILIRYVEDTVSVYMDYKNERIWQTCFVSPGVRLPEGYYFGASAATGDLTDAHDIISIRMYEIDIPRPEKQIDIDRLSILPSAENLAAPRDHVPDAPAPRLPGWKTGLLVIVAVVGLAVFLFAGVVIFQKRQERSRKRFY